MVTLTDLDHVDSILGYIVVGLFTVAAAYITYRGSRQQTAVTGFADLVAALQEQVDAQGKEIKDLRTDRAAFRERAREHDAYDREMVNRIRELTGESIPYPPPLDLY